MIAQLVCVRLISHFRVGPSMELQHPESTGVFVGVRVTVRVLVGVRTAVGVRVRIGVLVIVGVRVLVGVRVRVAVRVRVGVLIGMHQTVLLQIAAGLAVHAAAMHLGLATHSA